ncbi:MAG: energy transducer TonB [Gammaproteobacteria bacterium]|nr:energy transducer TonB [Gammaproteobacteria bacterium]
MTISRWHLSVTLVVALAIHSLLAAWLIRHQQQLPKPPITEVKLAPLHLSVLTTIAEKTVSAISAPPALQPTPKLKPKVLKPKVLKPKITTSKSIPFQQPKSIPKATAPQPKPAVTPTPSTPVEQMAESLPDTVQHMPQQTKQITPQVTQALVAEAAPPVIANTAPLDNSATIQYEQLLVAWLEKHKRYPRRAKRLRIEGEGLLRIRISPTGHTQSVNLEQSTGNRLLDQATLDMAKRANPFPAMPENMTGQGREFIVPVAFVLR